MSSEVMHQLPPPPTPTVPLTGRVKFEALEVGRGIAALLVVLHHTGNIIAEPRFYNAVPWGGHLKNFNVGIDFFFVLSGFIIAWVHSRDVGQPERLGHYALRRFLRIYPPYWGIMLPLAVLYLLNPGAGKAQQHDLANVFFSTFLLPYPEQPILGVAWTLVHEMLFYGLFGLLILWGRRAALLLPVWAVLIITAQFFTPLDFPLSILLSAFNLEFLFGVGAALILRQRSVPMPRFLTIAGCLSFLAFMFFARSIQDVSILARLAFGGSATVAIIGVVQWERQYGLRIPKPLMLFGSASYSIYLIHGVALSATIHILTRLFPKTSSLSLVILILATAGVSAGIGYHLCVEKPLSRWLRTPRLPFRATSPTPSEAGSP